MDIGMLWYDDDRRRGLDEKVARAAAHYRSKYGAAPTVCYVHPSMLTNGSGRAAGIQIRPAPTVMVNHFWVGVSDAGGSADSAAGGSGRRPKSVQGVEP